MTYPQLNILGPILTDRPYDAKDNPVIFNLVFPGHPLDGSTITLRTFNRLLEELDTAKAQA